MKPALQALILTVGLVASGYVSNQRGHKSGMAHGRVQGCQEVLDAAIPPQFSPICGVVDGRLTLSVTHPETGETRSEYIDTGARVENE